MSYEFTIERGDKNYDEIEPLYRQHFSEMHARLLENGTPVGEYNPRLDLYFEAFAGGWLVNYIIRKGGLAVGYANVYVTADMHTSEKIAMEDTIYVLPEHRNGIGRKLVKFILKDLKARAVKRVTITPVTDLRVGKVWKRMGFQDVANQMTYTF